MTRHKAGDIQDCTAEACREKAGAHAPGTSWRCPVAKACRKPSPVCRGAEKPVVFRLSIHQDRPTGQCRGCLEIVQVYQHDGRWRIGNHERRPQ